MTTQEKHGISVLKGLYISHLLAISRVSSDKRFHIALFQLLARPRVYREARPSQKLMRDAGVAVFCYCEMWGFPFSRNIRKKNIRGRAEYFISFHLSLVFAKPKLGFEYCSNVINSLQELVFK